MFWADKLLENRSGQELVNDAWTPSGIVHMGGLKGPVIHDTLFRIIKETGREVKFTFGFDDMDPIDGLPSDLQKSHEKYLGIPIFNAPAPSGDGSFGDYYGNMMINLFKKLDIQAEVYKASDYYKKGIYNKAIKHVLDNADKIRKVYEGMYKKPVSKDWYPLQVICPECGKLGTTKVTGWDGKEVEHECLENLVGWAKGCGHKSKLSPFDGNAKMPWKVEWAAKWWTFGVTIEGAGKDHASAGGSYDIAIKICEEVFNSKPPLKLPYEFFLWNGKKMASSKGIGLTGEELLEVVPPSVARFLMIKTEPNVAVEFNPNQTQIVPKLYDDYQKAEDTRVFELSQVGQEKVPSVRFSTLTQWVQMPNMEEEIKKAGAEEWIRYAKIWLEKYAPEEEKFEISKGLPEKIQNLSSQQKQLLLRISDELDKKWEGEDFQTRIYDIGKELDLKGNETFEAIYLSLLGKDHGPKAAWLILSLDKEFVKKRFQEISSE